MKNNISELLLRLSLIQEIGSSTIQNLLEKIGADNILNLHQFKQSDFLALGLSAARSHQLFLGLRDDSQLKQELDLIDKHHVQWTTIIDSDYPELLKHIQGAPPILYWKGNLPAWPKRALAVVGSRQANEYGNRVIDEVVPQIVHAGYAIVSGGALGADAMAHRAALRAGGATLVVVGTGLIHSYPAQHKRLFTQISESGGAIVSSFAMNVAGLPSNFPARNRIISGLSQGCLVVQAAAQSGAKITAHFALEQGREVFVVPGCFGDLLSAGCHSLAQQGAKIIHTIADILGEFTPVGEISKMQDIKSESNILKINAKTASNSDDLLVNLCSSPASFDVLREQLNIKSEQLHDRLFELQLQGRLKQNFAGLWEKG